MNPSIGIIGAGRLGVALGRLMTRAGYTVAITNSGDTDALELTLQVMVPDANALPLEQLVESSDIIILAIPLHQYTSLDPTWFKDKIIIDAMNYWPPTEGRIDEFEQALSSSEVIARYFNDSSVVKSFNHIAYGELEADAGTDRAMLLSGDDRGAKSKVSELIQAIGYDSLDLGVLSEGRRYQPDTPLFDARYTRETMPKA